MAVTRLGLTGTPAAGYSGFSPKTPAITGRADLTRLAALGIGWARGPDFSPKTPAITGRADLTRLAALGIGWARGPGFSPKTPAADTVGDTGWIMIHRRRRRHKGRTWR